MKTPQNKTMIIAAISVWMLSCSVIASDQPAKAIGIDLMGRLSACYISNGIGVRGYGVDGFGIYGHLLSGMRYGNYQNYDIEKLKYEQFETYIGYVDEIGPGLYLGLGGGYSSVSTNIQPFLDAGDSFVCVPQENRSGPQAVILVAINTDIDAGDRKKRVWSLCRVHVGYLQPDCIAGGFRIIAGTYEFAGLAIDVTLGLDSLHDISADQENSISFFNFSWGLGLSYGI